MDRTESVFIISLFLALILVPGTVLATSVTFNPSFVYGNPPSNGYVLLNFDNTNNNEDAVATIALGATRDPLYAIYIPAGEIGTIENMGSGRFDVFLTLGTEFDAKNRTFSDAKYYKITSPLIVTGKQEEQTVLLYAKDGTVNRIKEITADEAPVYNKQIRK
ncbi:MAG TPA: hypothetical protein VN372_14335 [Methanospirillum sp.]|nr:hypothetical protein [Methanospirillum sp.]